MKQLLQSYGTWRTRDLKEEDGIIVGCNQTQEWLLSWWWEHFQRHNRYPVSFVDFGLSEEKRKWCREKGELIALPIPDVFVKDREEVTPSLVKKWEMRFKEDFWAFRKTWFKKPFACLQSPYRRAIWIDLDCEIRGSLQPIFDAQEHPSKIAIAKDGAQHHYPFPMYNSGVIAFQRGAPFIQEWANRAFTENGSFPGDQDLLSHTIFDLRLPICELPPIYNWSIKNGSCPEAVIFHWLGAYAKLALQNSLILNEMVF